MNENKKADIYVLWTGGWDSTFRLVQIQKEYTDKAVIVQPVYISGNGRKSEAVEIETMNNMLPVLRKLGPNEILDLLIVNLSEIPENEEISSAYNRMTKEVRLGTQYDWIARLATLYPGIEVGIEKPNGEYSGCSEAIAKFGGIIAHNNNYYLDKEKSSEDCKLVFGNLAFPIFETTETEMVELVHKWHCEDVMAKIWFCHTPIDGQPCGYCRPCQQKMESHMEWLIPEAGQKRYRFFRMAKKFVGTKNSYKVTGFFCK